jgi:hypothetical protein
VSANKFGSAYQEEQSIVELNAFSPDQRSSIKGLNINQNEIIEEQGEQYKSFTSMALDQKLKAILEEARGNDL